MATDTPKMEFPQAFERRLGIQLVEEGLAQQRVFFNAVTRDLRNCGKGDIEECEAASDFMDIFGKTYLESCRLYLANLPITAFVSKVSLSGGELNDAMILSLMLFCEVIGPTGNIIGFDGRLTEEAKKHLAISTYMVHASKFTTKKPTETVDECLHRFITAEKAKFESMEWGESPEYIKWTPRYIYDMTITRTIEAMEPEFVLMNTDGDRVRFAVHQDIPGAEYYKATIIHMNLDVLLAQGVTSFENQIYRHPRYRDTPPDMPKEATVGDKIERDIATVILEVLAEIPEDVKELPSSQGYIQELNEILETLPFTAPEAISVRWNTFIEAMNSWMPPHEILEHEWMLKATAKLIGQPEERVLEITQRYVTAGEGLDD